MIVDPQGCEAEFPRWEDMRVSKLILPSESKDDAENKIIVKRKQYVTAEQLIAIGWREDVVTNGDGSEATLSHAPSMKDSGFKVPKTIGQQFRCVGCEHGIRKKG